MRVDYRFCMAVSRTCEKNFRPTALSGVCLPNTIRVLTDISVLCAKCKPLKDECAPVRLSNRPSTVEERSQLTLRLCSRPRAWLVMGWT